MNESLPPFQFDLTRLLARARRRFSGTVGDVRIRLPFLSLSVNPRNSEKRVAKEVVIRGSQRRVLEGYRCCDNCRKEAIEGLQRFRSFLDDYQVRLADVTDGALYLLLELMLEAIRQFLTFEQRLSAEAKASPLHLPEAHTDFERWSEHETYLAALELLRNHLRACMLQVKAIADIELPDVTRDLQYESEWLLTGYVPLPALPEHNTGNA